MGTASLAVSDEDNSPRYWVFTVFVLPECHGRGVGAELMERVEQSARDKEARTLRVPASITAYGFYERLGYTKVPPGEGAESEDHILMEKPLAIG